LDRFRDNLENGTTTRLELAGAFLEGKMTEKIDSHLSPALKAATVKRKGSSQPLVDKGELYGQIDHRGGKDFVEVGVFGSKAKIALHHEFGAPKAGIPERSFMRSAHRENLKQVKKIVTGK
jgi:phage gpG-like protein